jgi:uncharacterized membrane protein YphA (DoxX/SURF4 family)
MTQKTARNANRLLWTAQILLALLFLFAGAMKFVLPPEKLQGPIALPLAFIRFIGTAEVLGALGLILPGLLRIRVELTPLAAAGLVIIMTGATVLTVAGMGVAPALLPFIVGAIATTIAYGRWRVVPLPERSRQQILRAA